MPRRWPALDLQPAAQPRWLAKGRLPRAAVSLLIGDEGIGKSLLWVWIAAAVSTGAALPEFGIPERDPGLVIIIVTEDDWRDTVRPRLEVAKADLAMIEVICTESDGSGSPIFPRDMHLLGADPKPVLVVADAWLDTVTSTLTVRDPQQARQALHPWKEVATITDAAVMLICHTNRVATPSARDRYGITGELRKKARMSLFAQRDEDSGHLIVGPEKSQQRGRDQRVHVHRESDPTLRAHPRARWHGAVAGLAGESDQTIKGHITEAFLAERDPDQSRRRDRVAGHLSGCWTTLGRRHAQRRARKPDSQRRRSGQQSESSTSKSSRDESTGPWFLRLPQHHGTPEGRPGAPDAPVSPGRASGTSEAQVETFQMSPPSSQDSQMPFSEKQGHLGISGKEEDTPVPWLFEGTCRCGKYAARTDTGLCEWCTANSRREQPQERTAPVIDPEASRHLEILERMSGGGDGWTFTIEDLVVAMTNSDETTQAQRDEVRRHVKTLADAGLLIATSVGDNDGLTHWRINRRGRREG